MRLPVASTHTSLVRQRFRAYVQRELAERQARAQIASDPVRWVRERLGYDLWEGEDGQPGQADIVRAPFAFRRTSVRSGHGLGKTVAAACAALAYFYAYDDALVITLAPTQRQVETVLWGAIRDAWARARLPGECLQTQLRVSNTHYMLGVATRTPEHLQGYHAPRILVVADEASGMPPGIEEAIEGLLSAGDARLLLVGNPTRRSGLFYESHTSRQHLYHRIHLAAPQSPNVRRPGSRPYLVGREWIEERAREWGDASPLYQVRVLGEFPDSDQAGLAAVSWLDLCAAEAFDDPGPVVAGLDVARFGGDENALYLRRGRQIIGLWTWYGLDTMQTVGLVQQHLAPYRLDLRALRVDAVGLGAGVADRLRELDWPVVDFVAGAQASDPAEYANLRAEAYWQLRQKLRDGQVGGLRDERTQAQLVAVQYGIQSDRRLRIVSKDELRRRGIASPDRADALMMCFWDGRPEDEPLDAVLRAALQRESFYGD